jgi:tripartite-type tricarboxylate transporter receptor subunit TctC
MSERSATTAAFLSVLAALTWPAAPLAAEYPARPVRLLVPFPPGGAGDFQARAFGPQLAEQLRQQLVIDNRGGANGAVAHEIVAKAAPDGYTLLLGFMSALTINPALYAKLSYDPVKDFAPISLTVKTTLTLVANPSFPANSVKELIAIAKASPGKISYGSTGVGNVTHLSIEMLQAQHGVKLIHVPYKGAGPATIDVVGGQVPLAVVSVAGALPHVRAGRLKALFVSSKQRVAVMPDVPTVAEVGMPQIEHTTSWFGVLAPARTQKTVIARLNDEIVKAIAAPDVQARLLGQGLDPATTTPDEFAAIIKSDIARWAKVVKEAGIRAE